MRFRFDTISFFLGMAAATLVWWVISILHPIFDLWIKNYLNTRKDRTKNKSSEIDIAYRKALHRKIQGMHLAASIFALDEIIESPRLLVPAAIIEDHAPSLHRDIAEEALPFLPNFPEFGAFYNSPFLTLSEALSGGANLAIIGQPGTGKSTALAYLASQFSNSTNSAPSLSEFTPFLIHVADLGLPLDNPQKPEDLLVPIFENISQFMRVFDGPYIPKFVSNSFANGNALLLLDGMDELPQASQQVVNAYLLALKQNFPNFRLVITGSPEYLNSILSIGLVPFSIMPWGPEQQFHFINNWSTLWQKYVAKETRMMNTVASVNSILLNRWLVADNSGLTPLELTLKTWGAYSGDITSGHPVDLIEAHIRRITPAGVPSEALTMLAAQTCLNGSFLFDARRAREWTKSYEPLDLVEPIPPAEGQPDSTSPFIEDLAAYKESSEGSLATKNDPKKKSGGTASIISNSSMISKLVASGLLVTHKGGRLRFVHPVFMGLLAGKGLDLFQLDSTALLTQPAWAGQTIAIQYLAAFGDVSSVVKGLLEKDDPILLRPKFTAARLLRNSRQPRETSWRGEVMASMVRIIQDEDNPPGLRGEAMASLALSGDNNTNALFRQLLNSPSDQVCRLAALAAGFLKDAKSIELLSGLFSKPNQAIRQAACLALVGIGTPQALEAVAVHLLRGDESLRVYAAEALANHPSDGRDALREGIISEDILVRRAVIYGLARVREPWATELLEKAQINDEQWAVRNIAIEFLNSRSKPDLRIPKVLLPPHETPWVIELAGKYGLGVSPGQTATPIFLLALKDPNRDFFQPALNYLRASPSESVLAALYKCYFGTDQETREAVFQTLSYMALEGIILLDPKQFGLG